MPDFRVDLVEDSLYIYMYKNQSGNNLAKPPPPPPPDVRNPRPDVKSKHHPLRSNPGNRSKRAKAHRKTTITIKTSFKIEWIISFCRVDLGTSSGVNQYPAKLIYFNRHPLEFVSRYRDPQFQASDDYSYLFILRPHICNF